MKALRYLLMVVAMVSFLSVRAQGLAQQPNTEMHSTSVMVGAGSTLPQAAVTGVTTTENQASSPKHPGHIRRGNGDWEDDEWGDTEDPWATPLGDAMWPLLMLAAAYALLRVYKRKRSV